MNTIKYVGIDVHKSTCVIAVHSALGKTLQQSITPTRTNAVREFFRGLSGSVHVAFEVGTQSAWLYALIQPLVFSVTVCDPRHNKLLAGGNKNDRRDANMLATLLRLGSLKAVYFGDSNTRKLRELAHGYDGFVSDATVVMNRIKAIYRSRAIPCSGRDVYGKRNRDAWLVKIADPEPKLRVSLLYQQLDLLQQLRREAKKSFLSETRRHPFSRILRQIPGLGPIRVALSIAFIGTPHRFRTKRQLWAYCGMAVVSRSSSDYEYLEGKLLRSKKGPSTRGLNTNFNHILKQVFKAAALDAIKVEPFRQRYEAMLTAGIRPEMARLTIARKIAAITLALWKKGESFDVAKVNSAAVSGA